jgi:hypothetical protein
MNEGFVSFVSQNRGGRPPKLALEPVIRALSDTASSVTRAAIRLGCHRRTLHRFIKNHPEVQDHRKQVIEEVCDEARSNIIRAVMARNLVRFVQVSENPPSRLGMTRPPSIGE